MKPYKLIIAGGRDYDDYDRAHAEVKHIADTLNQPLTIISGAAQGADTIGLQIAKAEGYETLKYPADWKAHGKAAGPIRNAEMARIADALLAFWDGESKGTANMIATMEDLGKPILVKRY